MLNKIRVYINYMNFKVTESDFVSVRKECVAVYVRTW